jgi:hypothetical protein
LSKSKLGEAVDYALGQWPRLLLFLEHAEIELSTNLVENSIRPVAVGRNYAQHPIMRSWNQEPSPPGAPIERQRAWARFLADHLPGCRCPGRVQRHKVTMRSALAHPLRFMRAGGLILAEASRCPSEIDNELTTFTNHLRHVCGLACLIGLILGRKGRFFARSFQKGLIGTVSQPLLPVSTLTGLSTHGNQHFWFLATRLQL